MNKSELINAIAEESKLTKTQATDALDAFVAVLKSGLAKGEKIALTGVLSFEVKHQPARTGRNPATGAAIDIAAKNVVKVRAGKVLQDVVA